MRVMKSGLSLDYRSKHNTVRDPQIKERRFYCGAVSAYSVGWLLKSSFTCGRKTIDLFSRVMGLPDGGGITVDSVKWEREYFKIKLCEPGQKHFFLALKQYKADKQHLYRNYRYIVLPNNFVILTNPLAPPTQGMRKVLDSLRDNLGGIEPREIFKAVYDDQRKHFKLAPPARENKSGVLKRRLKSFYDWGNEEIIRTFMLDYSLLNDQDWWIELVEPRQFFLRCSDIECIYNHNMFDYAPCHRVYALSRGKHLERVPGEGDLLRKMILVNATLELKDEDIVMGCDSKIYDALDEITRALKGASVNILLCSCLNKLIGNDIDAIIRKINQKNNTLIMRNDCNASGKPMEGAGQIISGFLKFKGEHHFKKQAFNLIGFQNDPGIRESAQILKSIFGVGLNTAVFPELRMSSLRVFHNAKLQVMNYQVEFKDLFHSEFKKEGLDAVELAPPYGIKQTIIWLQSILNYFKIVSDGNEKWEKYYSGRIAQWRELTSQAQSFRLGFIVSRDDAALLTVPQEYTHGIPILKCLREMGFGIDILCTSGDDFERQKGALYTLTGRDRVNIELLNDPGKLNDWLKRSASSCIYSDFSNDTEVISCGKVPFSISVFEKGIDGAIRTLQRLLYLCRVNFFHKNRSYYSRTPYLIYEE